MTAKVWTPELNPKVTYNQEISWNKNSTSDTTAVEETGNNEIIESPLLWSLVALVIIFAIAIKFLITVFVLRKMNKIGIERIERERVVERQP